MDNQPRLLQLPYPVRCQIYRELGLIRDTLVLSRGKVRSQWSQREKRLLPVRHDYFQGRDFPNQLFYVSRSVSDDVRRAFYSEHRFILTHSKYEGLQALVRAGPVAWSSVRDLHIDLGLTQCRGLYEGCSCKDVLIAEEDGLFEGNDIFRAWRQLCVQMGPHVKDDQLSIEVVCPGVTIATAKTFLGPLRELPRLKNLSISLGPHRNMEILPMVLETIKQKTTFFGPNNRLALQSFPFLDLPVELQFRILEFTDLTQSQPLLLRPPLHWFVPSGCYWGDCSSPAPGLYGRGDGHWCSYREAAFSTVYPCWGHADLRFIGNRRIRDLAIQVYYSTNAFNVWYALPRPWEKSIETWINSSPHSSSTIWSPQTSGFLCGFPEYSWSHLRHIHWTFPRMHRNAFDVDYRGIKTDWLKTIAIIRKRTTLKRLTIEIDLSPPALEEEDPEEPQEIAEMWALYDQIVEPLACLRGHLKDLFIHCYFPMFEGAEADRVGREHVLERRIMGGEYDSLARGKQYTMPLIPEY